MKKICLLFTLSCVFVFAKAQTNVMFPDTNAQWSVQKWDGFGNSVGNVEYYLNSAGANGDTIINSVSYHKLFAYDNTGFLSVPNGYHAAIRKDLAARKVFIVPKDSTSEFLFYDFSKSAGDTVFNVYSEYDFVYPTLSHVVIDHVDSIFESPIWLRSFHHHCFYSNNTNDPGGASVWTEMAGGERGLFNSIFPGSVSSTSMLSCMSSNDTCYPYYFVGNCFSPPLGTDEQSKNSLINIYPNPFSSDVTVMADENTDTGIEIYNVLGEIIYSMKIRNPKTEIDLGAVPSGIYFARIINSSETITRRIIKN